MKKENYIETQSRLKATGLDYLVGRLVELNWEFSNEQVRVTESDVTESGIPIIVFKRKEDKKKTYISSYAYATQINKLVLEEA